MLVLKTLLITPDTQLVADVEPSLRRLEFEMDVKTTVPDAIDKMRYQRYSAVLVDCAAASVETIAASRQQWLRRESTVIAIASQGASTYEGIAGADAVWTQPLMPWEVHRSLLHVRTQETGDRRLRKRHPLSRPTMLRYSYDGQTFCEARILDITETGVSIEGAENVPDKIVLQVNFKLPAMLSTISTVADVVWRTGRRAGLHFADLRQDQRSSLERWLHSSRLGMSTGHTTYSFAAGY